MDQTAGYTQANRIGWDKFAASRPVHGARFFADGNSSLDDIETELLGDMTGRSLLHLACANGNDTLSWAALGATVTGVDISAAGLDLATRTAAATGLDATFVCADVYNLPASRPAFDVVYMSYGGICWMPDLDRWAQIVAATQASKRPGGWIPDAELTSFVWPVGDVLGSLSQAGLVITHYSEQPVPARYEGLGPRAGWLPASYAILARRRR